MPLAELHIPFGRSGFPTVSLKWMVTVIFTFRIFLLLLCSLQDPLLTHYREGWGCDPGGREACEGMSVDNPLNHWTFHPAIHAVVLDLLPLVHTLHLTSAFSLISGCPFSPCCCQQQLLILGFEAWNLKELILDLPLLTFQSKLSCSIQPYGLSPKFILFVSTCLLHLGWLLRKPEGSLYFSELKPKA